MGLFDMFKKKKEEEELPEMDLSLPDLGPELGGMPPGQPMKPPQGMPPLNPPSFPPMGGPAPMQSYPPQRQPIQPGFPGSPSESFASNPFQGPIGMPQREEPSITRSPEINAMKDMIKSQIDLVSTKIDSIKANIDKINERLDYIERYLIGRR